MPGVGVHLDIVLVWLSLNKSLRSKAKDENEHLTMNLDFNWTQLAPVRRFYS